MLVGKMLAGKMLAGKMLADKMLAGKMLADKMLADMQDRIFVKLSKKCGFVKKNAKNQIISQNTMVRNIFDEIIKFTTVSHLNPDLKNTINLVQK